ncbi:MAG: sugar phosphate isomerase/epimerase [Dictyoglomi bacterium]|nr:sugar phosphate isomerase/epimerase [Dictyoglomota bacterium]
MIKLGVNSVLFGGFDFATACKYIALAGYDGVEISAIKGMCEHLELDRWQEQTDMVKSTVRDNGLEILSMEVASLDEDRLIKAFEASKELGNPIVNVGPGGKSNVPEDLENSINKLKNLSDIAGEYGVTLCVKAHVGCAIYNTPTTLEAMSRIDSPFFGIDMDPSHIYRAGENPEEALPKVISRVKHIHIRDCKGRTAGPGAPAMQACGRGDINLMGYCKAMVDGRYSGPVVLEVIGALQLPLPEVVAIASESYGYLNACLKYLGAR